jgi:hypothetical protein
LSQWPTATIPILATLVTLVELAYPLQALHRSGNLIVRPAIKIRLAHARQKHRSTARF